MARPLPRPSAGFQRLFAFAVAKSPALKNDIPPISPQPVLAGYGDDNGLGVLHGDDTPYARKWQEGLKAWRTGHTQEAAALFFFSVARGAGQAFVRGWGFQRPITGHGALTMRWVIRRQADQLPLHGCRAGATQFLRHPGLPGAQRKIAARRQPRGTLTDNDRLDHDRRPKAYAARWRAGRNRLRANWRNWNCGASFRRPSDEEKPRLPHWRMN